ncbi:MAG: putative toxin-antitoxin system toxin component, PIN family [Thiotrichales bacterium]|jgi:putative PIN family toxin of toxin-antitoxin system|nr:putative toxin-antitoxin system toxin component, PIN family [Thiotrichales bacterium]MBT3837062.1 putative toxin-antitoxin system toxin component, PIN family [Thiotrichales bacterium]
MIITLDTNVILAGLLSKNGASHLILNLILEEKINIAISTPVVLEYEDVLNRKEILKRLNISKNQVQDIIDLLLLLADKQCIYYRLRPNLLDENDNLFIECAFASNSQYLVTSNIKDFERGELTNHPFKVITPGDFYYLWRNENE